MKSIQIKTVFILVLLLIACKGNNTKDNKDNEPLVEMNLSQEEAIEKLEYYVESKRKTVTVLTKDYRWVNKRVKCTQYDVDLNRNCSAPTVGAPYGYRTKPERESYCCVPKSKQIIKTEGVWKAKYALQDDQWEVSFEFNNGEAMKTVTWLLDDNSLDIKEAGKQ